MRFIAILALGLAICQAQLVIRVTEQDSDEPEPMRVPAFGLHELFSRQRGGDMMFSPSPPFMLQGLPGGLEAEPPMHAHPARGVFKMFDDVMHTLFDDQPRQAAPTQPIFGVVHVEEQPRDDVTPIAEHFNRLFHRMINMVSSISAQAAVDADEGNAGVHKGAGCPFVRACREDAQTLCAGALMSDVVGAVPMCLKDHRAELSEACGAMVDERLGTGEEEVAVDPATPGDESSSPDPDSDSESTTTAPAEEVGDEKHGKEEGETEAGPCAGDFEKLCAADMEDDLDPVSRMACLHSHKSMLSEKCMDKVRPLAAFHCSEDAKKLCEHVGGRKAIGMCLMHNMKKLSQECQEALEEMHHGEHEHGHEGHHGKAVDKSNSVAEAANRHAHSKLGKKVLHAGLAMGGLVMTVFLVGLLLRSRRSLASRRSQHRTVQLINPADQAVDITPVQQLM